MLKRNKLQLILSTVLLIGGLTGCNKVEDVQSKDTEIKSSQEQSIQTESEEVKKDDFDIYENIISSEYRSTDIESAFRNPSKYVDNKFTFSGTVLESNTSEDGLQILTVELDTSDLFIYGETYEDGTIVKLEYDIDAFGGERLVKDDRLAVCAQFKEINNDSKHGDIAKFEVLATTNIMDYLSSLALTDYFKSIGVDIKNIGLKAEEFTNYDEFEKIVGTDSAYYYGYDVEATSVFSTDSGVYWLAIYTYLETEDYGIQLYSGEKDEKGNIDFEYKGESYLDSYEF